MKKFCYLIAILAIIAFWGWRSYQSSLHYVLNPDSDARVAINILKGSSADMIADQLYDKNMIKSHFFFKIYLKQNGLADKLKAGRFVLYENYDLSKIAEALTTGKSQEAAVTLLEGWTAKQIGEYLESEGLTTAQDFMDCVKTCVFESPILPKGYVEGYLYPDTYFVDPANFSNEKFIARLINTLEGKLTTQDMEAIKAGKHTLDGVVIMASIVEREERNDDERPTVAGILWNRYDNGIGLGADATILYALGRTKGGLSYDELQLDSPYNTRKYRGLPPTPISNPSISSIRAAIYFKDTPYMYYLHGSDGVVHYGKTLEEHNENKRKYL